VATYTLNQPEKDRSLRERLMAAAQAMPRLRYRRMSAGLALSGGIRISVFETG